MRAATLFLVCLIVVAASFPTVQELYEARSKILEERYGLMTPEEKSTFRDPARNNILLTDWNAYLPTWNCTPIPPQPTATNVRQLRPQDIKVIAALGGYIL